MDLLIAAFAGALAASLADAQRAMRSLRLAPWPAGPSRRGRVRRHGERWPAGASARRRARPRPSVQPPARVRFPGQKSDSNRNHNAYSLLSLRPVRRLRPTGLLRYPIENRRALAVVDKFRDGSNHHRLPAPARRHARPLAVRLRRLLIVSGWVCNRLVRRCGSSLFGGAGMALAGPSRLTSPIATGGIMTRKRPRPGRRPLAHSIGQ